MMVDVVRCAIYKKRTRCVKRNKITEEIIQVENKTLTEKKDKAKSSEFLERLL